MLYSYECECGEIFDKIMKLEDYQKTVPCPKCGKEAKRYFHKVKIFHKYNIDGFYCTDYKSKWGATQ